MTELSVGLVQQACTADLEHNMATSVAAIRELAAQGARLIVLQELHRSEYFCKEEDPAIFDLGETIPGPSPGCLGGLAKELNVVIGASVFEWRAPGLYPNTAGGLETDGTIAGQ